MHEVAYTQNARRHDCLVSNEAERDERLLREEGIPDEEGNEKHKSDDEHGDEIRILPRHAVRRAGEGYGDKDERKTGDQEHAAEEVKFNPAQLVDLGQHRISGLDILKNSRDLP